MLVNTQQIVAKERAVDVIEIHLSKVKKFTKPIVIEILPEYWILSQFWSKVFYAMILIQVGIPLLVRFIKTKYFSQPAEEDQNQDEYSLISALMTVGIVLDFFKDYYYIFAFPHSVSILFWLLFIVCLQQWYFLHRAFTYEIWCYPCQVLKAWWLCNLSRFQTKTITGTDYAQNFKDKHQLKMPIIDEKQLVFVLRFVEALP